MIDYEQAGIKKIEQWFNENRDPQADEEQMRRQSSEELKGFYDSFVAAGFTDEQAMELLLTIVSAMIAGGRA